MAKRGGHTKCFRHNPNPPCLHCTHSHTRTHTHTHAHTPAFIVCVYLDRFNISCADWAIFVFKRAFMNELMGYLQGNTVEKFILITPILFLSFFSFSVSVPLPLSLSLSLSLPPSPLLSLCLCLFPCLFFCTPLL